MPNITSDGLTRFDIGCFIAVTIIIVATAGVKVLRIQEDYSIEIITEVKFGMNKGGIDRSGSFGAYR